MKKALIIFVILFVLTLIVPAIAVLIKDTGEAASGAGAFFTGYVSPF